MSGYVTAAEPLTWDAVGDLDLIRATSGDDKLDFIGFSYGTRLGSTYAETFPTHVRAMVLDGAVDPEQNPLDELVGQGHVVELGPVSLPPEEQPRLAGALTIADRERIDA